MKENKEAFSLEGIRSNIMGQVLAAYTNRHPSLCYQLIEGFLLTIDGETKPKQKEQINAKFDASFARRMDKLRKLHEQMKEWGELEKADVGNKAMFQIEMSYVYELMSHCWDVGHFFNLFGDRKDSTDDEV